MVEVFGLSTEYKKNQQLDLNTIVPKDIKVNEKKRLKEALKSVELAYQITGEVIPSVVNEEYNCQVIMFFNVELHKIKDAVFVADILQEKIKALCVLRLHDNMNECYSFAHKRLNKQDPTKIVVLSSFVTKQMPIIMSNDFKRDLNKYIDYEGILNATSKLAFYMEISVKAFILSNLKLYSKAEQLVQIKKLWFNLDEIEELFQMLLKIQHLKEELKRTSMPSDKAKINTELRSLIKLLDKIVEV